MCRPVLIAVLLLGLVASGLAAESGPLTLTIVPAEQKARYGILLYLVDTPIY